MRKRFETQLSLGQTPIEKVVIPLNSRDELPPVLSALQWIFTEQSINEQIFALLEKKVQGEKKATGRRGMDLWHILVLGVVRLALQCDYDRLEYLANYDGLMRKIMGLATAWEDLDNKKFHHKTISENVCHIDEELLQKINEIVAREGRELFKKNGVEKIEAKTDSYVVETNVHFPSDLNLLYDAGRKCIELLSKVSKKLGLEGWRKQEHWKKQIKKKQRECAKISRSGGRDREKRLQKAVKEYLKTSGELASKVAASIARIEAVSTSPVVAYQLVEIQYFEEMLEKHMDLVKRRLLKGEIIPGEEKVYSLFERHTEWINKGKHRPEVELGHPLLVTSEQHELIIDYKVLEQSSDVKETLGLAQRLVDRYGAGEIGSLSMDKGFSKEADRELLESYIEEVIMPKRGRANQHSRARESTRRYVQLRAQHQAIESNINSLEHHGLKRCPDKGLHGFKRYVGLGILAYNLHKVGERLQQLKSTGKKPACKKRAA